MKGQTSRWPSTKARLVLAALLRIGWADETSARVAPLAR
jgi:hypothetical protein